MKRTAHPGVSMANPTVVNLALCTLLTGLVALALPACSTGRETTDRDVRRLEVRDVTEIVEEHRSAKHRHATSDRLPALIDIRTASAYAEAHIPGAVRVPLPELSRDDPRLGGAKRVIVYGQNPRDALAPAAAKKLHAQGLDDVFILAGGFEAWREQGMPVASHASADPKP